MKSRIYLINTGNIKRDAISCDYNPADRIDLSLDLDRLMAKKRDMFDKTITPG